MVDYSIIQKIIDESDAIGILVSDEFNIRYISGFTGGTGYLLLFKDRKFLFTDFRYTIQAKNETKEAGYIVIEIDNKGYSWYINEVIEQCKNMNKSLLFENNKIMYSSFNKLQNELICDKLLPIDDKLDRLRYVKKEEEIVNIRKAENIGDLAFEKVINEIKPGMTELQVAAIIEYTMKINGATKLSFDTIVASGVNSSMPHAGASSKVIGNGDFVTMDFGCIYNGYCSDMTRTIVVGKASDEQKKVYNTVLKAQEEAFKVIRAGVTGREIDKAARDVIEMEYKGCFGHSLGHSVGLEIHENPRFSPNEDEIIQVNNVITVEPGIYIDKFGGVRIEDLIIVTENGYESLTRSSKKLIEL